MNIRSVQFSSSVVSNSLQPHELQHTRPPCPSPTPGVHSDSCPLSRWCHPAISSSVIPFSFCPPIPPSIKVFANESTLRMRWPKYWSFSFSISPSKEHPGLIFRMDWLDLLAVQGTLKRVFSNTTASQKWILMHLPNFPDPFHGQVHSKFFWNGAIFHPGFSSVVWAQLLHYCFFHYSCPLPIDAWICILRKEFQFSSVAQSCPTLCDPMDYSMPGFPVTSSRS